MSNPSANDDDEWEKAELNLESMKLTESKGTSKPVSSSASAPRFSTAPSLAASEANSNSGKFTPGSSGSAPNTPVDRNANGTEMVDSALVSALGNPRERMVVFQIENTILNFVKSSQDRTLDFPPQYNSFRRLIAYRIGQRFGLTHAQSEVTNENGERGITLFKTPGYRIPTVLLIDLNIPVQQDGDSNDSNNNYSEAGTLVAVPIASASTAAAAAPPAKKFQVMKRAVPAKSETDSQKAGAGRKEQLSSEDKERAYSEARARIFGEEPASPSPSVGTPATTPAAAEEAGASGASSRQPTPPAQQQQSSSSARSSNTSSPQPGCAEGIAAPVKRVTSDTQLSSKSAGSATSGGNRNNASPSTSANNTSSSDRRGVVSASNWKGNKSQTRDLQAERGDPDFARSKTAGRGGGGGGGGGYHNNNNGGNNYYNNQYSNQYANQQQQQFQQQQQYYYHHQQQQMGYPPAGGYGGYGQPQQQAGLRLAPTLGEPLPAAEQYYQQAPGGVWIGPPPAGPYNMASGGLHHPPPGAAVPGGYYPGVDPYAQHQAPLPAAPHMVQQHYDYSHMAPNYNQQQQQGQYPQQHQQHQQHQQGQSGRNRKGGGGSQQAGFNTTEFPPLA